MAAALKDVTRNLKHKRQPEAISEDVIRRVARHFWLLRGSPADDEWRDWFRAKRALRERMSAERISAEDASRLTCQDDGIPVYVAEGNVLKGLPSHGVAASGGTARTRNVEPPISTEGNGTPMSIVERVQTWVRVILRPGGEATPTGSSQSLPERRTVKMISNLPLIPAESIAAFDLIPSSVAFKFRVLPLSGHQPIRNETRDECGYVRLLCERPLTEEERGELSFAVPFFSFEYIPPGHEEFDRYREIANHLTELLDYYYAPEESATLY